MSTIGVAEDSQSVDDVLASIRKLVSEEARSRSEEAKVAKTESEKTPQTLMLTPELKVAKAVSSDQPDTEGPLVLSKPSVEPQSVVSETSTAPFEDEVALRALVAEMIREELQGELGNRITRNVRKLVQREIEIALKEKGLVPSA